MTKKTATTYGNDSISSLKGADRVRLRPGVIFGSDGLEGCEHSFFEILSNSIDEARQGFGKEITITRFLDHSVQVEDHGRGIPQEALDRITEPFYMVDKSRARAQGGAGLGLALCQRIASAHGAQLRFESRVGAGTTVSLILGGSEP